MRRLFVPPDRLKGDRVAVEGEAHRYLARVLRARAGDRLTLFDGCGVEADAEVVSVERSQTVLALGPRRAAAGAPGARIVLLQSLARGERMDWIVQKTSELGVSRIVPVVTDRSGGLLPAAAAARRQRWEKIAREAARQSGRADVPAIEDVLPLRDAFAASARDGDGDAGANLRLVLWESSRGHPLARALDAQPRAVTLLIGPEGGLAESEIADAQEAGFTVVGLGPRILRVETAAVVAVALVQAAAGGLD
jgi:16S rRNA (uracil1498-N3)-methyltransferase